MGSLYQPGDRSFNPLIERAKLPRIRFHDLRHTCATLLLSKDVNPKVVSEMLGCSSISVTLEARRQADHKGYAHYRSGRAGVPGQRHERK
jgi:integrase